MIKRMITTPTAIVDIAAVVTIRIDEEVLDVGPSAEPEARPSASQSVTEAESPPKRHRTRRPLLHHHHRRCGTNFVPHAAPAPRKITRSNL